MLILMTEQLGFESASPHFHKGMLRCTPSEFSPPCRLQL